MHALYYNHTHYGCSGRIDKCHLNTLYRFVSGRVNVSLVQVFAFDHVTPIPPPFVDVRIFAIAAVLFLAKHKPIYTLPKSIRA